jgi:arylsulfatase A-like enzyme
MKNFALPLPLLAGVAGTFVSAFAATPAVPAAAWPQSPSAPAGAPNVVLVMLDDTGFGASSTFGGPAETPALDRLAANGLKYNRFHVTPICSPTRAALLSGRNSHRVGFGSVVDGATPFPGYNGVWQKDNVPLAEVLRRHGYSTAAFGKWHNTPQWEISPAGPFDRWPTNLGFEYFYGFHFGEALQNETPLYRNTTAVEPTRSPEQGYHFTTDIVDDAIGWLDTQHATAPNKPYFLYLAPGATHSPIQAPEEWIAKYRGKFDQGWDRVREETFAWQKKLGVIPADAELTPRPKEFPAWDSLTADQKRLYARQAEVFAAFLAHTDHEVGRLLEAVRKSPGGDNTLVLYIVGDNGGCPGGGLDGTNDFVAFKGELPGIGVQEQLKHIDELGSFVSDNHFSVVWAWATNTPFQWTKGVGSHLGGIRDPLVVAWPARIKEHGAVRDQFTHVNDVAPTLYELLGITPPSEVDGVKQLSLDGVSFAASFTDPKAPSQHTTQYFEAGGSRSIYHDGWMASARHASEAGFRAAPGGYENDRWELYHLDADYSQARNLATEQPQKLAELRALFEREAEANHVYPLGGGRELAASRLPRPDPIAAQHDFIYAATTPRLPNSAAPTLIDSHRIVATVEIPASGAEGVLLAHGARFGGFALFIKDGRLVYENNFYNRTRDVIVSNLTVPTGHVELVYEFTRENPERWGGGTGRLFINGKAAGEGKITKLGPPSYLGSFGVGRQYGSPVSNAYHVPFAFTGKLEQLAIHLASPANSPNAVTLAGAAEK